MNVEVFIRGVRDGSRLREVAQQKLSAALQRHQDRVRRATMRIEDETGPNRHKVDKICSIELLLSGKAVRIREAGKELWAVIEVALDRARAALRRRISREKPGIAAG